MSYPPGYGPQGYGNQGYAVEHPDGTLVLVLGILGLVVCQLCAPFAWSKGNTVLRQIDADPSRYSNRGAVQAGRICGIVGTLLFVVPFVLFAILFGFLAIAGSV